MKYLVTIEYINGELSDLITPLPDFKWLIKKVADGVFKKFEVSKFNGFDYEKS